MWVRFSCKMSDRVTPSQYVRIYVFAEEQRDFFTFHDEMQRASSHTRSFFRMNDEKIN